MANLIVNLKSDIIEDHLAAIVEKLETIRENKEAADSISKNYRPPFQTEIRTLEFWRSIISECLATFFLVIIVSGTGLTLTAKAPGAGGGGGGREAILGVALATGFGMAMLNQSFGKISGGHVNPAVSLAMAATKKISPVRAIMFVVAQCGGGIAGAAFIYGVGSSGQYQAMSVSNLGSWESFGVELVLTFIIVFTHYSVSERKLLNNGSMMIGFAYTACSFVGLPMLNPARALGPAFVMNKLWENHWVFWMGPVIGGVLAAVIHDFIFNSRRHGKRSKDSINGDSSSIQSEDEPFEDNKYHPAAYRPVGSGNATSPGGAYCPSVASASVYSSPPTKLDRTDTLGSKFGKPMTSNFDGIYSGTRSLYNAKISEGIYSGTKSMYTKSPSLTRASLNRSQSVYAKSQNPRDLLPKPGPLIPAQSLYPIKLGNSGHFSANIRDFSSPNGNFITGIKTNDGNFVKVPQINGGTNGFNLNTINFLAGRNGGSKSFHDISDVCDKTGIMQQQNYSAGNHMTNQNVQNQHLQNAKPEKSTAENIYGVRNSPTGGIYPGNDTPRPESIPEIQGKREGFDLMTRDSENRVESIRNQANSNFSRTAAYVKSVQNTAGCKPRESNYDIVPGGIREVPNFSQKPHNRSETSDYGSNRSDTSIYGMNRSVEMTNRPDNDQSDNGALMSRPETGSESRYVSKRSDKMTESNGSKKTGRPELPLPPPEEVNCENRGVQNIQYQPGNNNCPPNFTSNVSVQMQNQQWNQMQMRTVHQSGKTLMPPPSPGGMMPTNPLGFVTQRNENRQSPLSSVSSSSFTRNSPNPAY